MTTLTPRLQATTKYVRKGAFFADIGTDHAYLPIYLLENKLIEKAVASDINFGPLERAKEHIKECNLQEKIATILTNGLNGIETFHPTDIAICGMGGELIASILDSANFVKNQNIRLILQPMTKQNVLRIFLWENGFSILEEEIVREENRLYQILVCSYVGKKETYNQKEATIGKKNLERKDENTKALIEHEIKVLNEQIEGKKKAINPNTKNEEALLKMLSEEL